MIRWIAAGSGLLLCLVHQVVAAPVDHPPLNDACLRAVYFVDAQEGWAAGDDGVIWHSIDGGQSWERQPTGTRASLQALHFVNPFVGWAVGREELPDGSSHGVILATTNGGLKWNRLAWNTLPGLHAVRFFDEKTGIVAGFSNDRYSSGVFRTEDAGRSWTIVPGERQADWLAADFQSPHQGILAGSWGRFARIDNRVERGNVVDAQGARHFRSIVRGKNSVVAVGQGGMIHVLSPANASGELREVAHWSRDVQEMCDFHSVCCVGDQYWVVGRPGTFVLRSQDGGRTWQPHSTGQPLPLHAVFFHDEQTGWAVGELGTILTTTDAGQTWTIRRSGGRRLAMLALHASPDTTSWDVFAHAGADSGYLVGAIQIIRPDERLSPFRAAAEPYRRNQALRRVGGAVAENLSGFPLAPFDEGLSERELWAVWDHLYHGHARKKMLAQLVLALRLWQPELLFTDPASDGTGSWLLDVVREAFRLAADETSFPEQLRQLNLKTWAARRVLATVTPPGDTSSTILLVNTEPMPRSGDSPQDLAERAIESVGWFVPVPASRRIVCVESRPPSDKPLHLFDGITLAHGGTARRDPTEMTADLVRQVEERRLALRRCRTIEALARADASSLSGPDKLVPQLSSLTRGLPSDLAARSIWRLGRSFAASGQWTAAQDTFDWMIERYGMDPLSAEALRWLAAYSASAEARRRYETLSAVQHGEFQIRPSSAPGAESPDRPSIVRTNVPAADSDVPSSFLVAQRRGWHSAALPLEKRMAALGSLYLHDPRFQFALQSARRSLGEFSQARAWMKRFVDELPPPTPNSDPWRDAAVSEVWLSQRIGQPHRPIAACFRFAERPILDGRLDDPCWSDVPPVPLSNSLGRLDDHDRTEFRWGFDAEFLYFAVESRHAPGRQAAKVEHRRRDETLDSFDRVSILLDIDRDYQTYFHLQVDQRGCVRDDCWGDLTWNPKWFVAHSSHETGWTVEVAIPWTELSTDPPGVGMVWACHVTRIIPGRGLQAWSWPSNTSPQPEGMGLLIFSDRVKK